MKAGPRPKSGTGATAVELLPGDVAFGFVGDHFRTLLGSCVSVLLTDPRRTVGSMCHIVHVGTPPAANQCDTAFAEPAMRAMYAGLRGRSINPNMCEAYVYGGANMFPDVFTHQHVGARNAAWVMDFLEHAGITVLDYSLGGTGYRKVAWIVGADSPLVETVFAVQGVMDHGVLKSNVAAPAVSKQGGAIGR